MVEEDGLRNLQEDQSPYDLFVHITCFCMFPYLLGASSLQSEAIQEIFVFDLFMGRRAQMNSRWIKQVLGIHKPSFLSIITKSDY